MQALSQLSYGPILERRGLGPAPTVAELRAAPALNQAKVEVPPDLFDPAHSFTPRRRLASVVVAVLAATNDARDIVVPVLVILEEGVIITVIIDVDIDIVDIDIVILDI